MIDRYTLQVTAEQLKSSFSQLVQVETFDPYYNAAPTKKMPVTKTSDPSVVRTMQWGLISILSNNKKLSPRLYNANISQLSSKSSLRKSIANKRCVIYADGFFLWKSVSKKTITPYYVYPTNQQPFAIGGYWEEKDEFIEQSEDSFMMLTRDIIPSLSDYHQEMPFIINKNQLEQWLNPDTEVMDFAEWSFVEPAIQWSIHAVSPAINDIQNNDARLLKMTNPTDQHGNYTLFG